MHISSLDFINAVEKQKHPLFIAATSGSVKFGHSEKATII